MSAGESGARSLKRGGEGEKKKGGGGAGHQ